MFLLIGPFQGYFWSSKKSSTYAKDYVAGAPNTGNKGGEILGAVFLCQDCFIDPNGNTIKIQGHQYGEKFGQTLCPVDINGDGYDDLVVGAPFHSNSNQVVYMAIKIKICF